MNKTRMILVIILGIVISVTIYIALAHDNFNKINDLLLVITCSLTLILTFFDRYVKSREQK